MRVYDLEHCSDLTPSEDISGGVMPENLLSLRLVDRRVLLSFGNTLLFDTLLPDDLSGLHLSLENIPGIRVSVSSVGIGGHVRTLSLIAGQATQGNTTVSFASSSTTVTM